MHPMLNTAVKAARKAGAMINRASLDLDLVQVSSKGPGDFVTEVDRAVEHAIIETLKMAYPAHAIVAEESGHTPASDGRMPQEAEFVWIIDPIDGTTNFIHGVPQYCVSIALMHKGVVTQACVYDPSHNELFTASRGRGAFLNDRRIRVSRRTKLHDSLFVCGFPHQNEAGMRSVFKTFMDLTLRSKGVRRTGSSVLNLAYVAAGRYDGFFGIGLKPWDIAAGSLLVLEAGGLIGDFGGEAGYMENGQVVAATPKIFSQLLPLLEKPLPRAPAAAEGATGTAETPETAAAPTTLTAPRRSSEETMSVEEAGTKRYARARRTSGTTGEGKP